MTTEGAKGDGGKFPLGLIPRYPLEQVAAVLGFGEVKYGRHNWRKGILVQRNLNAALRHVVAYNEGEDLDPESGLSHLAHAICCLMFALETAKVRPDLDDRYNPVVFTRNRDDHPEHVALST